MSNVMQRTDAHQSVSAQMRQGNSAMVARIRTTLKDHAPKVNHHFCPPLISKADSDRSHQISRGGI
jgi:hypothetical protein